MVMDQWQASLMRALAQLQLQRNPEARTRVAAQFDMAEGDWQHEQQPQQVDSNVHAEEGEYEEVGYGQVQDVDQIESLQPGLRRQRLGPGSGLSDPGSSSSSSSK